MDYERVLVQHEAELQVIIEMLTALLVTHPAPRDVLAKFQQGIDQMTKAAPNGTDPEEIVELRARAAQHLIGFELALRQKDASGSR